MAAIAGEPANPGTHPRSPITAVILVPAAPNVIPPGLVVVAVREKPVVTF